MNCLMVWARMQVVVVEVEEEGRFGFGEKAVFARVEEGVVVVQAVSLFLSLLAEEVEAEVGRLLDCRVDFALVLAVEVEEELQVRSLGRRSARLARREIGCRLCRLLVWLGGRVVVLGRWLMGVRVLMLLVVRAEEVVERQREKMTEVK